MLTGFNVAIGAQTKVTKETSGKTHEIWFRTNEKNVSVNLFQHPVHLDMHRFQMYMT